MYFGGSNTNVRVRLRSYYHHKNNVGLISDGSGHNSIGVAIGGLGT